MRRAHRNRDGRVENVDIFGLLVEDLWRFEHQRAGGTRSNGGDVLPGKESVTREIQQDPVDRNMVEPVEAIKLHDDSVAG